MYTYYATVPEAAATPQVDGHLYANTTATMYGMSDGRRHIQEQSSARMMRVSHVKNGLAFIQLGKAGDAVACVTNLPFGTHAEHTADTASHPQ